MFRDWFQTYILRNDGNLLPMPELDDHQEEREVEEMRGIRKVGQQRVFLIKWAGWPSEYNSYKPEEHMENAQGTI